MAYWVLPNRGLKDSKIAYMHDIAVNVRRQHAGSCLPGTSRNSHRYIASISAVSEAQRRATSRIFSSSRGRQHPVFVLGVGDA